MNDLVAKIVSHASKFTVGQDVHVISIRYYTWGDTSLGCSEPGYMYAQVMTPGMIVSVLVGEIIYTYHTDMNDNFKLAGTNPR